MKHPRLLAALLVLGSLTVAACGGSDATSPASGDVVFKVDAQSCTGSASLDFFIDGSLVGTEPMSSGANSKPYHTTAGAHLVGARTAGRTWPTTSVTVPADGTYTALLTCV